MDEQEKIKEILASEDAQFKADLIKIIEQANIQDKEKALKLLYEYLISKRKEYYPIQENKAKEEKREYTETFNSALQEEIQKKQQERSQKLRMQSQYAKALRAYGKESSLVSNKVKSESSIKVHGEKQINNEKNIEQIYEESQEMRKTFLEKIEEMLDVIKELIEEESTSKETSHRKFMERLQPSSMQKIESINTNNGKSKENKELGK